MSQYVTITPEMRAADRARKAKNDADARAHFAARDAAASRKRQFRIVLMPHMKRVPKKQK